MIQTNFETKSSNQLKVIPKTHSLGLRQIISIDSYEQLIEPHKLTRFKTLSNRLKSNKVPHNHESHKPVNIPTPLHLHKIRNAVPLELNLQKEVEKQNYKQNKEKEHKQCNFCAEMLTEEYFKQVFQCEHLFCKNCLVLYFKEQISNFKLIECPIEECRKAVNEGCSFFKTVMKRSKQKYELVKFRKSIQNNKNLLLCPNEQCKKGYILIKEGVTTGKCVECETEYCLKCKMSIHEGNCERFEQILLQDKFKYKKCYGCQRVVERYQGCPHMTCRCSAQFCYYCGNPWEVPHRCIRYLAGGELITDKLNEKLKCLRLQKFEYEYNFAGFLSKTPYYLISFIILLLYLAWCTTVFAIIMCLVIAISSASGYFVMIYKICSDFRNDQKYVFVVLCVIFFPLAFLVGILVTIAIIMQKIFFIYLSLALSAKLFPCYVY